MFSLSLIFFILIFLFITRIKISQSIIFSFCIILIFLVSTRTPGFDKDYFNYEIMFNDKYIIVEPTFTIISNFVKNYLNSNIFYLFFIYATISIAIKYYAIHKLSSFILASYIIFLSNFFLLHEMTQIRAAIASGLMLISILSIQQNKYLKFLLINFIAVFFHYSALIILPLWFFCKIQNKYFLSLLIPLCYLIFIFKTDLIYILPIPGLEEKLAIANSLDNNGSIKSEPINVFNYYQVYKIFLFYILYFFRKKLAPTNDYFYILLNIYMFSIIALPLFYNSQMIGFRISQFYGIVEIILLPLLFNLFKPYNLGRTSLVLFASCHFIYVFNFSNLFNF